MERRTILLFLVVLLILATIVQASDITIRLYPLDGAMLGVFENHVGIDVGELRVEFDREVSVVHKVVIGGILSEPMDRSYSAESSASPVMVGRVIELKQGTVARNGCVELAWVPSDAIPVIAEWRIGGQMVGEAYTHTRSLLSWTSAAAESALQWMEEGRGSLLTEIVSRAAAPPWGSSRADKAEPRACVPESGLCNWVSLGPRNLNGPISSLAVHPYHSNILYAGAALGGVWKSDNAGESWIPLMQYESNISVSALAIYADGVGQPTLYVGTGGYWALGGTLPGDGIFMSSDGGDTWIHQARPGQDDFTSDYIARIAIDPTDSSIVYAVGSGGFHRTKDGGDSWETIDVDAPGEQITDLVVVEGVSTAILYVAVFGKGVFFSEDRGDNWFLVPAYSVGGLPMSRFVALAVGKTSDGEEVLFVKQCDKLQQCDTVYMIPSPASGEGYFELPFPTVVDGGWLGDCPAGAGNVIACDPEDSMILYAGSEFLGRGNLNLANEVEWTLLETLCDSDIKQEPMAQYQQAIAFAPGGSSRMYVANGSGVFRSDDKGDSWRKVSNGLAVAGFEDVEVSACAPMLIGGAAVLQGTSVSAGGTTWNSVEGGWGKKLIFHPTERKTLYSIVQRQDAEFKYLTRIQLSTDGGHSWDFVDGGIGNLQTSPTRIKTLVISRDDPSIRLTGMNSTLFSWTGNPDGDGIWWSVVPVKFEEQTVSGVISALAVSSSAEVDPIQHSVFVGTTTGQLWRCPDFGSDLRLWERLGESVLPNRRVTDIEVAGGVLYVAFAGYESNAGGGSRHIFSLDGTEWKDISVTNSLGNFINQPTNAIVINPLEGEALYVATDAGVFRRNNEGEWIKLEFAMPTAHVQDLELQVLDRLGEEHAFLVAAVYGRGIWQLEIGTNDTCRDSYVYARDNILDNGLALPSPSPAINPMYPGNTVRWYNSADIKVSQVSPDDLAAQFGGIFDGAEFDRNLVNRRPRIGSTNWIYVQVHNRGPFAVEGLDVRLIWANASGGLPILPSGFWDLEKGLMGANWHAIGSEEGVKTILRIEPGQSAVIAWEWVPVEGAEHVCLMAIIGTCEPLNTPAGKRRDPAYVAKYESHITQRNVYPISATPGEPKSLWGSFTNVDILAGVFDFVLIPDGLPEATELTLAFPFNLSTTGSFESSVEGATLNRCCCCWILSLTGADPAAIRGVILDPGEAVPVDIGITLPRSAVPGKVYWFTIEQRLPSGDVIGGITYEIQAND